VKEGGCPVREIGPVGTIARIVGGAVAITVPIALHGFGWSEAVVAVLALPLVAAAAAPLIMAVFRTLVPGALERRHAICSPPGCALIAVMVAANGLLVSLTGSDGNVTLWVWLGASMLVAAGRGYSGCEVLAAWSLITGRRDRVGCILYTPIDAAEARVRGRRPTLVAAASATVAATGVHHSQDDRRSDQNCQDKADDQPAVV
jgi:hypothetical protein